MKHSYKILNAEIQHDHAENRDFLNVEVQVFLDGEIVDGPRRFGFALDIEEVAIRAELDRLVVVLDSEAQSKVDNADFELKQEAAKKTIDALLKKEEEKSPEKRGSNKKS